ncbi:MAG: molybdopterin molybdenumtransferase MoeA, partial [Burkholderiaceae bacterium]|nr:molybdopterin molybdenumtransferase MoeA [Burkholderiaceae bacterium]
IAVKPGKPLAFGEVRRGAAASADFSNDNAYFLGLPGNPVSSFVTFLMFVRPFILKLQGMQNVQMQSMLLRADFSISKADKRNEFLRARMNANGGLDLFNNQGSGVLTSTVWADGLVDLPAGHTVARGDMVKFIPMNALLY